MIEGVDYSTDRPHAAALDLAGKRFAARYVGLGTADKHLTRIEVASLNQHGIAVVLVAEGGEKDMLGGWNYGVTAGRIAYAAAADLGVSDARPIYWAVDFDCTAAEWPAVRDALQALGNNFGTHRVGVYGSYNVIEWARRDNVADWFWQTYAWSHGQWSVWNTIEQYQNNVSLGGGTVDLNRTNRDDYGQWMPGQSGQTEEDDVRYLREESGSVYREDGTDPASGRPILWPIHDDGAWNAYQAAGAHAVELDHVDWSYYTNGETAFHSIEEALNGVKAALSAMMDRPIVDPVAVANAIAARPEIARTLAEAVAGQLDTIVGSLSLTGSLSARIVPPER